MFQKSKTFCKIRTKTFSKGVIAQQQRFAKKLKQTL